MPSNLWRFFSLFPFLKSVFGCNEVSLKATENLNLYSPSWPFIHDLSALASQELGLQACLTTKHLLLKDKTIHIFRTSFYYFAFFLCDAQGWTADLAHTEQATCHWDVSPNFFSFPLFIDKILLNCLSLPRTHTIDGPWTCNPPFSASLTCGCRGL